MTWPATVRVALRGVGFAFLSAAQPTDPSPVPRWPKTMVNQDVSLLAAVQAQPLAALTVIVPLPPAAVTLAPGADTWYVHWPSSGAAASARSRRVLMIVSFARM